MTNTPIRTRFAPSPTGFLHIGNLRTALYSFLYARKTGGTFVLRIEDTDVERTVDGALQVIFDTLQEAGINFDEGPGIGGAYGPYIQSERKNDYMKFAQELVDKKEAYFCFCTKERLDSLTDANGTRRYDKHCLGLSHEAVNEKLQNGESFVIRQNMPSSGFTSYHDMVFGDISVENKELEDNILIKSDGMPTYNFANVIDDHLMAINCVMRGAEYLSSTPKYNLLYKAFGWEIPTYIHLPPIMKDAVHKLSKRNGDASFADLVKKGFLKQAIINYIVLLGWSPKENVEKMSFEQLQESFSIEGISKSQSIFDEAKLKWLNGLYIKELTHEKFVEVALPFLRESKAFGKYDTDKLCALIHGRVETLCEIAPMLNFLEEFEKYDTSLFAHQKLKTTPDLAKEVLPKIKEVLQNVKDWNHDNIHTALINLVAELGVKNGAILWPTRVALSGKESTPGGATELAELLGKTESLKRIDFSLSLLLQGAND